MTIPFINEDLPGKIEAIAPAVVALASRHRSAAGVLWRDGLVVTSAAVLWRAGSPSVILPDGERVAGEVVGSDAATDLAVVRVDGVPAPALRTTHEPARVGDFAFAVARGASGLVQGSFGFVGCVAGEWKTWRGARVERLVRLDGGLYPGFDGAPVADAQGRVIGIASAALSRHHAVVLPVATVGRIVAQIAAHGRVRRGWLGIAAQPVRVRQDGREVEGLMISSVSDDGPAARAGLRVADVILQVGATPVGSLDQLRDALALDADVVVRALRGEQVIEATVTVAERPAGRCG